jgi:hypothetical protein
MSEPIVLASLHLKPAYLAAIVHPPNLPKKERQTMAIVKAHVMPLSRRPRLVLSPESVKYYINIVSQAV